jgi:hypothetical protein
MGIVVEFSMIFSLLCEICGLLFDSRQTDFLTSGYSDNHQNSTVEMADLEIEAVRMFAVKSLFLAGIEH